MTGAAEWDLGNETFHEVGAKVAVGTPGHGKAPIDRINPDLPLSQFLGEGAGDDCHFIGEYAQGFVSFGVFGQLCFEEFETAEGRSR